MVYFFFFFLHYSIYVLSQFCLLTLPSPPYFSSVPSSHFVVFSFSILLMHSSLSLPSHSLLYHIAAAPPSPLSHSLAPPQTFPEAFKKIREDGQKGDFLALVSRYTSQNRHLTQSFVDNYTKVLRLLL